MKKVIPTSVFLLCKSGALIVGSCAEFLLGMRSECIDYDLIVPPEKWHIVSLLIESDAGINNHGGFRFMDRMGNEIDIWPSSIDEYLRHCKPALGGQTYVVDYITSRIYTAYMIGTKDGKTTQ